MEKIKLMTDTTSDIPDHFLKAHNIDMLSIPITVDGEGYYERESFTIQEFYDILSKSKEIPKTSRIVESIYLASYEKAYHEGYTHLFNVTLNAGASGTNASAQQALASFYSENPEAKETFSIEVLDSKTYSVGYGHGLILAAEQIKAGATASQIHTFLTDWCDSVEIYLGCYTLEYAKKSGRINAAVAFVGEVLGMRPIIRMVDGKTEVVSKTRGNLKIVDKVFEEFKKVKGNRTNVEVMVAHGRNIDESKKLQKLIEKNLGRKIPLYPLGAAILINAGPDTCAFVMKGEKRC